KRLRVEIHLWEARDFSRVRFHEGYEMNIQIFGTKKSADTRKAERFFKERGIKFQFVDLKEKGLSKGELNSVKQAVGGIDKLIDENAKDKDTLALIKYIADEDKEEKLLENQQILVQPIVRNGKKATVGYQPDVWKEWD
ncbi:Arsenate reductase, glutaredoxin family, partial [Lachnospiraceae bacterium NE2001]